MSRRRPRGDLPDHHLWDEVKQTVTPLRPEPAAPGAAPLPLPVVAPAPRVPVRLPMPSYQSDNRPGGAPPSTIEPRLRQRLMRGQVALDGRLDLHGMRQDEAHGALTRFIMARSARGDRTLLVITGKGLKKLGPDAAVVIERGVLRAMLPYWLSTGEIAPLVAGWDMAAQAHGGDGAFYVRLRRQRDAR